MRPRWQVYVSDGSNYMNWTDKTIWIGQYARARAGRASEQGTRRWALGTLWGGSALLGAQAKTLGQSRVA